MFLLRIFYFLFALNVVTHLHFIYTFFLYYLIIYITWNVICFRFYSFNDLSGQTFQYEVPVIVGVSCFLRQSLNLNVSVKRLTTKRADKKDFENCNKWQQGIWKICCKYILIELNKFYGSQ